MKHIISLGAGVQSSTMALMAACGELGPMPFAAIFADTQDEPKAVYAHLEWLKTQLPFPVYVTTRGKLSEKFLDWDNSARMPFFVGAGGIGKRQCTREFKIRQIRKETRRILGYSPRQHIKPDSIIRWVGISTDEADRMKPSGLRYETNRWPFLEDETLMSRGDCERWLWEHFRRRAPKSACKQCPYQPDDRLRSLKAESPEEFAELCEYDARLRSPENVRHFRGEVFVHRSRMPLIQIDFSKSIEDKTPKNGNLFSNECEGICGV